MKKVKSLYLIAFTTLALALFVCCQKTNSTDGSLYTPTATDATASASLQELQQGRTLYINNCKVCHGLYSPDDFTPTQWRNVISSMAPKTDMTTSQIQLVTKYVTRGK